MSAEIERSLADYTIAARDVDIASMIFTDWGSERIEQQLKCSPNAFVQMAIQLAYFKASERKI